MRKRLARHVGARSASLVRTRTLSSGSLSRSFSLITSSFSNACAAQRVGPQAGGEGGAAAARRGARHRLVGAEDLDAVLDCGHADGGRAIDELADKAVEELRAYGRARGDCPRGRRRFSAWGRAACGFGALWGG
eukprot:6032885-Prymnesium_polylepis.1